MKTAIAGIAIPDSKLAVDATELLRAHGSDLIYNHSLRVFLFGALHGKRAGLKYDSELLYIGAVFHDFGLIKSYSSATERFEVDGANAAREFLRGHGIPEKDVAVVWDAIALHTTLGIPKWKESEVALLTNGVELDVMGIGYHDLSETARSEIVAAFPRPNFKHDILRAFLGGFAHKPETCFGNVKADVCAHLLPGYKRPDFVEIIGSSPWVE